MIAPETGEVAFDDGLWISAHICTSRLLPTLATGSVNVRSLPIEGWLQHTLGTHSCGFGAFDVEVTTGIERRVEAVFLSHRHSFYDVAAEDDSERRAFHEGVIATDLLGQREFSWGHVFCRLDRKAVRDWLVVIYSPFSAVPLHEREVFHVLFAHEKSEDE
jgi:hypothetical protein